MTRPGVNITPIERVLRVAIGAIGTAIGLLLLASASGAAVAVLEVLLVLAGLDLVVTGAIGHWPAIQAAWAYASFTSEADMTEPDQSSGGGGHGFWMMVACCVPMVAIFVLIGLKVI